MKMPRPAFAVKSRPSPRPNVTYDFAPINKNLDAVARSTDPDAEFTEAVKAELADTVKEMEQELVAQVQAGQAQTSAAPPSAYPGPPRRRHRRIAYSGPQPKPEPLDVHVVVQPDNAPTNKRKAAQDAGRLFSGITAYCPLACCMTRVAYFKPLSHAWAASPCRGPVYGFLCRPSM
jgi:hypothetical protein